MLWQWLSQLYLDRLLGQAKRVRSVCQKRQAERRTDQNNANLAQKQKIEQE